MRRKKRRRPDPMRLPTALLIWLCLMNLGCAEEQVRVYELPKQVVDVSPDGAVPGSGRSLSFQPAEGWKEVVPSSSMVRQQFTAGQATVSHSAFPGAVGGDLANLNRWRGQLGLGPVDLESVPAEISSRQVQGIEVRRVDLDNGERRLLVDMIRYDGMTWFIKITGPVDAVEKELSRFNSHVQSLRVDGHADTGGPNSEAVG